MIDVLPIVLAWSFGLLAGWCARSLALVWERDSVEMLSEPSRRRVRPICYISHDRRWNERPGRRPIRSSRRPGNPG